MKHIYTVTGMTCNGCRTSVEDKLNTISGILNASVDLESSEAIIEMSKHISTDTLQDSLSSKYVNFRKEYI